MTSHKIFNSSYKIDNIAKYEAFNNMFFYIKIN